MSSGGGGGFWIYSGIAHFRCSSPLRAMVNGERDKLFHTPEILEEYFFMINKVTNFVHIVPICYPPFTVLNQLHDLEYL